MRRHRLLYRTQTHPGCVHNPVMTQLMQISLKALLQYAADQNAIPPSVVDWLTSIIPCFHGGSMGTEQCEIAQLLVQLLQYCGKAHA